MLLRRRKKTEESKRKVSRNDNPTDKIDIEGEDIKDKINERSVRYTRR